MTRKTQYNSHFFLAPAPPLASGQHYTTVAWRKLNLVFDSPSSFREQTTIPSGVASGTQRPFSVSRCVWSASCRANHSSAMRRCPVPFEEQSVHLGRNPVASEQLFSRSGRSSRRSILRNAPAAASGRPTSTSPANAIRRLQRCWSSSTKFAAAAAERRTA